MGLLYNAFTKQEEIISAIERLYTHSIFSQKDNDDSIMLNTTVAHNFMIGGTLLISGVKDSEGANHAYYNNSFVVKSIPSSTSVLIAKNQQDFGFSIEYDTLADFENATITNVRVYNDPILDVDIKNYPLVLVDIDDTIVIPSSSGEFIPAESLFQISVIHRIYAFPEGVRTQLKDCRKFVSYKLEEILETLSIPVASNVSRTENIISSEDVTIVGIALKS